MTTHKYTLLNCDNPTELGLIGECLFRIIIHKYIKNIPTKTEFSH